LTTTAAVSVLTFLVLRAARRAGAATRLAIVLSGTVLSIAASTLAVALEMYLSGHDLIVLAWVIAISAILSMGAAWIFARSAVQSSVASLLVSARRLGHGDIVESTSTGLPEFDALSAQLADSSQRLAEARAQVAELDRARKQMLAWISHDLRTPLAGMRAMAEAIEEGSAADPGAYISLIRGKIDTVAHMVGDLFELSKLQTGSLELHPEPVILLDLVSDAVSDVHEIASSRGVDIIHDGIDGHIIWADARELTRAIGNLLANGVRHAPENSTIVIRADTLDDDQLILSIIDQGAGVTAENLGHMFDIGWRADPSRATHTGGAGLGLAIVRGIVEAHGGRVQARHTDAGFQLDLILPTK